MRGVSAGVSISSAAIGGGRIIDAIAGKKWTTPIWRIGILGQAKVERSTLDARCASRAAGGKAAPGQDVFPARARTGTARPRRPTQSVHRVIGDLQCGRD